MSFWDHLGELRSRLIKAMVAVGITTTVSFFGADWILKCLVQTAPMKNLSLIALQPAAVFMESLRLSIIGGVVLALPILLHQLWSFIRPGLAPKETKAFLAAFYFGTLLFIGGSLFAYFFVIPTALHFFWDYSAHLGIQSAWTIDHYLNFVLMFLLSFGLAFELPLIFVVLVWLKIISADSLASKRPTIIVGLAIAAGILTPPDVVSQLLLLIPLWLLFEVSLLISNRLSK